MQNGKSGMHGRFSIVHWHVLERRQTFQLTRFSVKLYLILYGQFRCVVQHCLYRCPLGLRVVQASGRLS